MNLSKYFLFLGLILASLTASAELDFANGYGSASGYCNGRDTFCPMNLRNQAQTAGTQDAETRCFEMHGRSLEYTSRCDTNCIPDIIPPNEPSAFVSCRASCTMQCEVP